MPITDNSFTPEEFGAALAANPALLDGVKSTLTAQKYEVLSADDRAALLSNHEATVVSRKTTEHATALEKDVFDLTGIPKNAGEKYYDYFKRATGAKVGEAAAIKTELDELRSKGNTSDADKSRIKALEKQLNDSRTDLEGKLTAAQQELLNTRTQFAVESELAKLRATYKAGIPDSVIAVVEKAVVGELMQRAKMQDSDGKQVLTFLDNDGNVMLDQTTFKPAGPDALLKGHPALKDLIDAGRQQAGTGTSGDQGNKSQQGQGDGKFTGLPADVTTKVKLTEYLLKLGIMDSTEEFNKIMSEHGAKLPLR